MCTTETASPVGRVSGGRALAGASPGSRTVGILPSSCGRWIVAGRFAAKSRSVVLLYVVLQHASRGELGARRAQRVAHLLDPAQGHAGRVAGVVERDHLLLEQAVEAVGVGRVGVLALARGRDGPPVQPV